MMMGTDEADGIFDRLDGWYEGHRAGAGSAATPVQAATPAAPVTIAEPLDEPAAAATTGPGGPVRMVDPAGHHHPLIETTAVLAGRVGRAGRRLLSGAAAHRRAGR